MQASRSGKVLPLMRRTPLATSSRRPERSRTTPQPVTLEPGSMPRAVIFVAFSDMLAMSASDRFRV